MGGQPSKGKACKGEGGGAGGGGPRCVKEALLLAVDGGTLAGRMWPGPREGRARRTAAGRKEPATSVHSGASPAPGNESSGAQAQARPAALCSAWAWRCCRRARLRQRGPAGMRRAQLLLQFHVHKVREQPALRANVRRHRLDARALEHVPERAQGPSCWRWRCGRLLAPALTACWLRTASRRVGNASPAACGAAHRRKGHTDTTEGSKAHARAPRTFAGRG
jgi:hypothetical protein